MEAFREFARALEIEPDNPYALVARGYARLMVPLLWEELIWPSKILIW